MGLNSSSTDVPAKAPSREMDSIGNSGGELFIFILPVFTWPVLYALVIYRSRGDIPSGHVWFHWPGKGQPEQTMVWWGTLRSGWDYQGRTSWQPRNGRWYVDIVFWLWPLHPLTQKISFVVCRCIPTASTKQAWISTCVSWEKCCQHLNIASAIIVKTF